MYYVKMTFTPFEKTEITEDNAADLAGPFWIFLNDLSNNGQAYKHQLIHDGNVFTAFFLMPEPDTLEAKNSNDRVLKGFSKIEKQCGITTEILGRDAAAYKLCGCGESSWYILYTHTYEIMSPMICGDCRGMIPTYKLNHPGLPKEASEINWQREYDLITELWYLSSFDGFTYRQQSSPQAQLSKSGREVCTAYEKALGKPFYYFLFHYSESGRARGKKCPVCGKDWTLKEDIGILSYKCDRCRLVSC